MIPTRSVQQSALAALLWAAALAALPGCAVTRGQSTMGAYMDDTAITTAVKARFVESKTVDGSSISVQTLNGTVMLSGFARSNAEKTAAGAIASGVSGVKSVKNGLEIRM